ncbi:unnamed protein product [Dicrocoelium dendriticum]|nr:unnamed protein product [Dicrocoelium dendriticum]
MLEGSEQLSRIKLSSSTVEGTVPSPSSATTISVRTVSPNSVGASPQPPLSSPTPRHFNGSPTQFKTEGLLYNLLVHSESTGSQAARSPFSCASPLLATPVWNNSPPRTPSGSKGGTSESNDSMAEYPHPPFTESKEHPSTQPPSTIVSWPQAPPDTSNPILLANGQRHPHSDDPNVFRASGCNPSHRTTSMEAKDSAPRPYTRAHGATISALSDSTLTLRARLQHRRQPDGPLFDVLHHRAKMSARNRSISKSQENSLGFNVYTNGISLSRLPCQNSSIVSSPRTTHHTQSAQARLTNTSGPSAPAPPQSHRSSGYCSATSQLSSALSTDSGLDRHTGPPLLQVSASPLMEQDDSSIQGSVRPLVNRQLVQLAKKTARPVQARVTEWLRQVAEFVATSAPVIHRMKSASAGLPLSSSFDSYGMESWVSLLAGCWHRLLALSMVEHALDLVVVEDKSTYPVSQSTQPDRGTDHMGLPWLLFATTAGIDQITRPDRQFANGLTQFMSEIRQATLSAQEFYLLRHVILLTTEEPEAIPNIGLNVIRASRYVGTPTEAARSFSVASNTESQHQLSSPAVPFAENASDRSGSTTAMTFDLACLVSGLKALCELCPYQVANLFCAHLRHGSTLNKQFLSELHNRYVNGMLQLNTVRPSANNGSLCSSNSAQSECPSNGTSILEQLFDNS